MFLRGLFPQRCDAETVGGPDSVTVCSHSLLCSLGYGWWALGLYPVFCCCKHCCTASCCPRAWTCLACRQRSAVAGWGWPVLSLTAYCQSAFKVLCQLTSPLIREGTSPGCSASLPGIYFVFCFQFCHSGGYAIVAVCGFKLDFSYY